MHTTAINYKQKSALRDYFTRVTTDTRCMRNTACFYIRNTMTGLSKSPEERTHLETEVLHDVFTSIHAANTEVHVKIRTVLEYGQTHGGLKAAVTASQAVKRKLFRFPSREKWFLSYETLDLIFKRTDNPVYRRMPSQVNQNAIRKTVAAWESWINSLKDWKKHPGKYLAKPRIPGYIRNGCSTAWWTNQVSSIVIKGNRVYLKFALHKRTVCIGKASRYEGMKYIKTEVVPYHGQFRILVTFDDHAGKVPVPEHPERILGIDLGLDNFAAAAGNFGEDPFVVKGGVIKAVNQWYNKRKASLLSALTRGSDSSHSRKHSHALEEISRKREDALRDLFYKCSWYLCRYAVKHGVEVIVLGQNKGWKQEISMGKQNNQNFVSVPYDRFRQILAFVAGNCGIPVICQEESYTSKASLLDLDVIPVYGKDDEKPSFSGKRVKRGLYQSADGTCLNADINGAGNILRKKYPYAFEGKDLSFLWKTTSSINLSSLYVPYRDGKRHRSRLPGISSRLRHKARKQQRLQLLEIFQAGKKSWQPQKAAV